ncbi:MAG: GDSL-type esterase/lipase family protein [Acidobacteriota bacterium]
MGAPSIACPADISKDVEQGPLTVDYPPPVVTGGSAPISIACTAASGSSFPGGTTDVVCTATDAIQQKAQCLFHVNVNVIPKLKGTTFLAFGDSITWGEVSASAAFGVHELDPLNNYPVVLQALLRDKYRLQTSQITVDNKGVQGEKVQVGAPRLGEVLRSSVPDVLILLEGTNDANDGTGFIPGKAGTFAETADVVVSTLRDDVRQAQAYDVKLIIWSTLLPEVAGRPGAGGVDRIPVINDVIRDYEGSTRAVLVDAFAAFDAQKELLIGADGVHPTVAGYKKLAGLFLDAIAANFQQPAPAPASPAFFSRPPAVRSPSSTRMAPRAAPTAGRTSTPTSPRPR